MGKVEIWMRVNGRREVTLREFERLRLIYPTGEAEWADGFNWSDIEPCWLLNMKDKEIKITKANSVKAMKRFDRYLGYKTIKIGEV